MQAGNAVSFFGYGLILPFEIIYLHQIRRFATATAGLVLAAIHILARQVLMHASWVGGGIAGALADSSLPGHAPTLGFVFTALFVVLAVEASLTGRKPADPLLALACALVARVAAPGQMLLLAMGLYCALPHLPPSAVCGPPRRSPTSADTCHPGLWLSSLGAQQDIRVRRLGSPGAGEPLTVSIGTR